ncbi:hypothetical protein SAMN05216593_11858 [Pseudomonas asturiensis]|uniref:DUF4124 domain-containing protein n=1 Tax=Pseudomonas asturiensis TaxID=1190415 RepID=A0A1M7Q5R1_9PSED|nr:DUF4124 domain-containing protein [Pseudomonas asturiensis]SHN25656.1 hypothetical protein SAMN05216593_11858 [Pseudomonas asturiensis]
MKRLSLTLAVAALSISGLAHSEIFKCTSPQGRVSYASMPCESGLQSSVQRAGPPNMLSKGEPVDQAHKLNLKATEYLKVSGRASVTVYETESYKAFQRNRPPPPNVPSQCHGPHYDSQCFDPSGGTSSRKAASGN